MAAAVYLRRTPRAATAPRSRAEQLTITGTPSEARAHIQELRVAPWFHASDGAPGLAFEARRGAVVVQVTTQQVWSELERQVFAVVGMVTARGEARTVGIVPVVRDGVVWFASRDDEWKVTHLRAHPQVSVTYVVPRAVPLLPWIKVPAATVTFQGVATVVPGRELPPDVWRALTRGLQLPHGDTAHVGVRIEAVGDFLTYGIGTSLLGMRDTAAARGRVAVA